MHTTSSNYACGKRYYYQTERMNLEIKYRFALPIHIITALLLPFGRWKRPDFTLFGASKS